MFVQRAWPLGSIPKNAWLDAAREADFLRKNAAGGPRGGSWQLEGPMPFGGRLIALAVHPSEPQTIYAGSASGGIFKSTNGGTDWAPIFDQSISLSIGDVVVAPSDKNVLFVGTGEPGAGTGSVTYDGAGVFRSSDAGATWQSVGLEGSGIVGKIAVHPTDASRVFVAACGNLYGNDSDRGLYRSKNGGAAWEKVLFLNDSTGFVDVAFHPAQPDILIAASWERLRRPERRRYAGAATGIFRSTDGGDTWTEVAQNVLTGDVGRIGFAASESQPGLFYAVVAGPTSNFKGIYKSTDAGATWSLVFADENAMPGSFYGTSGHWFSKIWCDPKDAQHLFVAGVELFESHDGGKNWDLAGGFDEIHADHHAMWINPSNPQQIYEGNDGGFYISENGGGDWLWTANLPNAQCYAMTSDPSNPDVLYTGVQDYGTWRTPSGATDGWEHISGGDGFASLVHPQDPNIIFALYQYGGLLRSLDNAQGFEYIAPPFVRANWSCPMLFHPNDPSVLFFGTTNVMKTEDLGDTWQTISPDLTGGQPANNVFGTISTLSICQNSPDVMWAGTDDGSVWTTKNGGTSWQKVVAGLPKRWVTRVTASPTDPLVAYATFSGFRWDEPLARVFRTANGGISWQAITGGLPDAPCNDIILGAAPGELFVGTDVGVFQSTDDGQSWLPFGAGMPILPVNDLHLAGGKIHAATYGRGIFSVALDPSSTGFEPKKSVALAISPNPASGPFRAELTFSEKTTVSVSIVDLAGRSLFESKSRVFEAGKTAVPLDAARLKKGPALVVVRSKTGVLATRKIVVAD